MSILRVPKRRCVMCNVKIQYSEYMDNHKEQLSALRTTVENLDRIWDDFTIPIYCEDCIQHSRLDVDLCQPDKI